MTDGLDDPDFLSLEAVFKALADKQRIRILNYMPDDRQVTVSYLVDELGMSQSQVSYHVKQLLDAGLIDGERDGNVIWYGLVDNALERLAGIFS